MASYSAFTKIKGDNLSVTDGDGLLSREDLHRFHSRLSNNFSNIEQLYFNKRNNDWSKYFCFLIKFLFWLGTEFPGDMWL